MYFREKAMARIAALAFLSFLAVAAGSAVLAQSIPDASAQVPLIEPATLHNLVAAHVPVTIVDVRQPEEFAQGHIQGAILMPLGTVPTAFATLPKTGKLIVYCRTGHRSAKAVEFLLQHGYGNAVSMDGGYAAWTAAGF
jgi:rhodanese-related sulfurtransferase